MGYTLDKDGIKDIKYCDYVEITDVNDDEYIYNVFYSDEYGLCLCAEDEPAGGGAGHGRYYLYQLHRTARPGSCDLSL